MLDAIALAGASEDVTDPGLEDSLIAIDELDAIVEQLAAQLPLPDKNRDHALTGDYIGFRECHIRPDWLLVYRVDGEDLILFLFRTGTHTDLFD